ncbi:hypothetical protein INT47_008553 [Mucor saturninus]|uniref:Uncharacterized protein n=1 Tax=Mucor saturninus TaxID=64648 RepID=A0A8H7RBF2_9FUNG|nr:hypothetical protein INT47_008553 [Mucor saturninus]
MKLKSVSSYKAYLEEDRIENLRLYKYGAVDKSPISKYILKHYWDFAIKLFPRWIAPNLITLIGLFFMIANVIIVCIWAPLLDTTAPNWINFSFAAGLWLYSTFDNVDGRQARRTGTSSPLGELFDHGCDAINCTYVALLQCAALGLGHSPSSAILLFVTIIGFYLSTAEEYYTGILYLGYVNGPTEGIIVTCLAFIWSGIYGIGSWHVPLKEISCLSWMGLLPSNTTFADVFVIGMVLFFVVTHLPVCVYSIAQACNAKGLSKWRVFGNVFLPIVVTGSLITFWIHLSSFTVYSQKHFILFAIFIGFLFGEMASDIILAHLTKSEFPLFRNIYYPLALFALLGALTEFTRFEYNEYLLLIGITCVTFVNYMIRAVRVINAFCEFLNIRCLVIPHHPKPVLPVATESESLLTTNGSNYSTI